MEQVMLDMIPTGAKVVCHVSQYDMGRTIRFNLRSGGSVYTLSGTETVKVYIKKPDGTTAERNIANTSSTYVDWVTGEGDCDQAGNCECELVITSGTTVIGSKNFTVKIEEDPYNDQGVVTETAGPAVIATFTTNVVDLLQEVKCSINPIQNGTPWIDSNEVNKVPYIKRNVAGTATRIGNYLYDKLVGGTVAFNQLIEKDTNITNGNLTISTNASTKKVSLNLSADGGSNSYALLNANTAITVRLNHKYIVLLNNYKEENAVFCIRTTGTWKNGSQTYDALRDVDHLRTATILNAGYDGGYINLMIDARNPYTTPTAYPAIAEFYPQLIDLTAMFGSTIADYIYSLEQATAGAGVAWFKALFPNDYYAYNAGELMSVKATAHVMKNASNQVIGNYALDSNLVLNGLFKLDANNKLYADGDTYESSGVVGRRYALSDMGSFFWDGSNGKFYARLAGTIKNGSLGDYDHLKCLKYNAANVGSLGALNNREMSVDSKGNVQIRDDDYTDPTVFKNSLSGQYLLYEKATPTTEQASPFTNPQVCDENGTEEYVDNRAVAIPVGHETYQTNICPISGIDELNIKQSGQDMSEIAKLIRLEFDDTVYLAEVSCLNGVWKLKLLGAEVDLGDLNYSYNSTYHRFDCPTDLGAKPAPDDVTPANALCSCYKNGCVIDIGTDDGFFYIAPPSGDGKLRIVDSRYSDVVTFKAAVSGNKLVYELATPTEIILDETEQFEALLGVNNVWHDGNGNTEVKYLYNA